MAGAVSVGHVATHGHPYPGKTGPHVDQLHAHLHTLLTQPAQARQWGLAGRARVAEAFSLEASCAALLALYRDLV
jgi:glycosyltransferase involved in cell wall biosynthesis